MAAKTYFIDEQLAQATVSKLASLPWGQVNDVMAPLMNTLAAQDQAFAEEAAKAKVQDNAAPLSSDEKAA